jgi:TilS substrate C-terminal domain
MSALSRLYTLDEVADQLRYAGRDRERSVRRLFGRHHIPLLRRDRSTFLVAEQQLAALMEAMKCSQSENEGVFGTSVVRSVSARKLEPSKSTLRDVIARKMPKPTGPASKAKSGTSSYTGSAKEQSG